MEFRHHYWTLCVLWSDPHLTGNPTGLCDTYDCIKTVNTGRVFSSRTVLILFSCTAASGAAAFVAMYV